MYISDQCFSLLNNSSAFYVIYLVQYFHYSCKFSSHINSIFSKNIGYSCGNTRCKGLGKQFLYGQRGKIGWYKANIRPENDQIMNVNHWICPYMRSDVYNKRLSEIRVKLIKCELKQWMTHFGLLKYGCHSSSQSPPEARGCVTELKSPIY